ncbi:cysteine hydrolase family protein [Priestia taiwanensis]|uniref:Isochorismatase n=1 Tax=Priestia taiwanensis TaxID=1347902 RepID=A0A917ESZ7_9BACI|nr:isochorismatase family cysteine hydrolase [Priestia taiwanensis]MBM7365281.1 nicotinamidase-related amidase [Priestia taiwanensis]GGE85877.1 isochorismatase [Priestia taiwanensis]
MKQSALLIIDMINDFNFEHGPILAEKTLAIVPNILAWKKQFQKQKAPIIYINDHYNLWQANMDKIIHTCTNERSNEIIHYICPKEEDYFLIKPHYSAFYDTPLHTLLQSLHINHLVITGIAGNICVLFTANDAYMRKYTLSIPSNCIASNSDEDNTYALRMMEHVLRANITPITTFH